MPAWTATQSFPVRTELTDQKFNDPGLLGWMETPEPPMVFVGERVWTEIGVQKAHFMITENHLEPVSCSERD